MEPKKNILTKEGLDALEAEIEDLRINKRAEIAEKLKEARAQGDLSENAEYDAAKDEQRDIEARIKEIEQILQHVEVVDGNEGDADAVNIESVVKLLDMEFNEELEYKIVGSVEADILNGKISNESPLGKALIGAKKGETVTAVTEAGEIQYKILDVKKAKKKK